MRGKQGDDTELFQLVTMEMLVPSNHRLRRLHAVLDLSFVDKCVASLYSPIGRTSVDPEVVVRMWILMILHGYSERELCDEMQMHAGFRWFCGLSFNDRIPDQSTLVKLRTKKWAESGIWAALLRETVRLCEAAGIASPDRMGVDGTQIRANAATVSLEEVVPPLKIEVSEPPAEEPLNSVEVPQDQAPAQPELRVENGGRQTGRRKSGDPDWHGEKFGNDTHRSTTDPEARLYRKGKQQGAQLRYLGHYLVDVKSGVIYDAMATQATGTAEREATIEMLDGLQERPRELVMDLGYRDGDFLVDVRQRGVMPIVPIGDEKLEQVPVWTRETRDLARQKKRSEQAAIARVRNAVRIASRGRSGAKAQRQRTRLEHLFAEGKDHHGLARAQGRGLKRVDQQVRLTAAVQNLKRLLASKGRRKGANTVTFMPLTSNSVSLGRLSKRLVCTYSRFQRNCGHFNIHLAKVRRRQ
jgi:transposase